MSWLRLDDDFDRHPKVAALSDREFRVHIRVLLYCCKYSTSGTIPESAYGEIPGLDRKTGRRFLELGLWEGDDDSSATVHDFPQYNPKDATKAERQARWRARLSDKRRDAGVDGSVDADVDGPHARAGAGGAVPSLYISREVDLSGTGRATRSDPPQYRPAANTESRRHDLETLERYVRAVAWQYETAPLADDLATRGADGEDIAKLEAIAAELRAAASASQGSSSSGDSAHESVGDGGMRDVDHD